MIPFKTEEFNFEVPSSYGELTLGQLYELKKCKDDGLEIFTILSGIDRTKFELSKDLALDVKLNESLEFLQHPFSDEFFLVPDFITVSGKKYKAPKSLVENTYGQKIALQNYIIEVEKEGGNETDAYAFALALYMQPIITGKPYDIEEVEKLVPEILNCKLQEAWPLAGFFLSNFAKSLNESLNALATRQATKKYKLELIDLKNSENFRQFSPWRRFLIKLLTRFSSPTIQQFMRYYSMGQQQLSIRKS